MTIENFDSPMKDNTLIGFFMGGKLDGSWIEAVEGLPLWVQPRDAFHIEQGQYHLSWDWLMPVIRKINGLGKEYQFAIFKTYVSCTVEKHSKYRKDFAFSNAAYITQDQSDIEAAWKTVCGFIKWYNENVTTS